ncbi:MAG: phosphoribosylformylglycinamidine synthase subunit PurS [Spirochaetota bacterium]
MKAIVNVYLKKNILDPQGVTVQKALSSLGFGVSSLRIGKRFEIEVDSNDPQAVKKMLAEASDKLLANPVIEDFEVIV